MQVHKKEKMERHISLMESERTGILWQSAKVGQKTFFKFFALSLYTLTIHRWIFPGKAKHRRILPNANQKRLQIARSLDHLSKV